MPAELENTSVMFTEEAEVALKRGLSRLERRLRGRAVDEAVRTRGVPAEVTGSDIERALNKVMNRRYLPNREWERSFVLHPGQRRVLGGFVTSDPEDRQREHRRSLSEWVARLYMWVGAVGALAGVCYAPVYHRFRMLSADPAWRLGFLMAAASFCMFILGLGFKIYLSKVRLDRNRRHFEGR
jgi:hypothetical protein